MKYKLYFLPFQFDSDEYEQKIFFRVFVHDDHFLENEVINEPKSSTTLRLHNFCPTL